MQRLYPDTLGMLLHMPLFNRMVEFATRHTPEIPPQVVIADWLGLFYSGSDKIHILVDFDDNKNITGHCVIFIQEAYGHNVVMIHQLQDDTKSLVFLSECAEYADKLMVRVNATCCLAFISKNQKAFEKKFGYNIVRYAMVKTKEDQHG